MRRPHSLFGVTAPGRPGRVIGRDEALAAARRLLTLVGRRSSSVQLQHAARVITKVANNKLLVADNGNELAVRFDGKFGTELPLTVGADRLDDTTLRRVIAESRSMGPPLVRVDDDTSTDPNDPRYYTYNKREYLPVSLWHDATATAMDAERDDVVASMLSEVKRAGLVGAATLGLATRTSLTLYEPGLTSWSAETDCEVTLTARTPDGTASGWAGQAHRDWGKIDVTAITRRAIEVANQSRGRVAMEPGRYTVILSPEAVAQLLRLMPEMFDAFYTDSGQTPFSKIGGALTNKIGELVMDRRVRITSDPQDPDGGYPPFFELGSRNGIPGFPVVKQTLVEDGVLTDLSYNLWVALDAGKPPADDPYSLRLEPMPGVETATVDQMIANCEHGFFVNRLSDVALLDLKSGMMTGVTRDGCFYIKNGKIVKPVKNFRFAESPLFVLNQLEMIGAPKRVAFGYTPPSDREWQQLTNWPAMGRETRWPLLPVIAPPIMVRDFRFVALADVV